MSEKPNCYDCKHRGSIPGDAHSKCKHPDPDSLDIEGHEHGKKHGWFYWPVNFDPTWLLRCDGFEVKTGD